VLQKTFKFYLIWNIKSCAVKENKERYSMKYNQREGNNFVRILNISLAGYFYKYNESYHGLDEIGFYWLL